MWTSFLPTVKFRSQSPEMQGNLRLLPDLTSAVLWFQGMSVGGDRTHHSVSHQDLQILSAVLWENSKFFMHVISLCVIF